MKCPDCNKEVIMQPECNINGLDQVRCPECGIVYSQINLKDNIDWNYIRTQAAIAAMQALIGILDNVYDRNLISTPKLAVEFADALIAELKKGE